MRRGVASLRDDSPSASAKGAKSAKGDRLVVQVEVVGLDDGVVALVLPGGVGVGGETTFHCRLVGDVSVDQRVSDSDVQQRLASVSVEVVNLKVALPLRAVSGRGT